MSDKRGIDGTEVCFWRTHVTIRGELEVNVMRVAEMRRADREPGGISPARPPDGLRLIAHEELTKRLGGPRQVQQGVRVQVLEDLFAGWSGLSRQYTFPM